MESKKERQSVSERFAAQIIQDLKEGTAPWQKPWKAGEYHRPMNPVTGTVYKGINAVMLSRGYADPRWMTMRQANDQGWRVKKGSRAQQVVFWQWEAKQKVLDATGKPELDGHGQEKTETVRLDRPRLHVYPVFHASQLMTLDGQDIPAFEPQPLGWVPEDKGEAILAASGASITHDQQDRAFYRPSTDEIHLPPKESFPDAGAYYSTALHELGHYSGHPSRLNREFGPYGSEQYAREELRAEISSWMLNQEVGLPHLPEQHLSYVDSWVAVLQKDPYEIMRACRDAEQIKEYVMGLEQEQQQAQTVGSVHPSATSTAPSSGDASQSNQPHQETDNGVRLYHGGNAGLSEIKGGFGPGNPFGGLFFNSSREAAASHNDGHMYVVDIPKSRILTQHDLSYEIDAEKVETALRDAMHWIESSEDYDVAYEAVIDDRTDRIDDDDLLRVFREDTVGEATWEAQRIRGEVARLLGYHAVAMSDEHGTSYLVLPGVEVRAEIREDQQEADTRQGFTVDGPQPELGQSDFKAELSRLLKLSTLAPAKYLTTAPARDNEHAAVFADGRPVILTGWTDNPQSLEQAVALAQSDQAKAILVAAGYSEPITADIIAGRDVPWNEEEAAIATKQSGQVEPGGNDGLLVAVVLNDPQAALTTNLSITTETARILDPNAPELDDGRKLASLAQAKMEALEAEPASPEERRQILDKLAPHFSSRNVLVFDGEQRQGTLDAPEIAQEKTILNVPYKEKDTAKAAGAKWDREEKRWYAPEGTDLAPLQAWLPSKEPLPPPVAVSPVDEFAQRLQEAGLILDGPPIMDGEVHRVPVEGGKPGAKDGAYCGYGDGRPAGWLRNFKTGEHTMKWYSTGHTLTGAEKESLRETAQQRVAERNEERQQAQERGMKRAYAKWINAVPAPADNPYLANKGIGAFAGVKQDHNGNLLVPGYDLKTGRIQTVQHIMPDSRKRMEKDCPQNGAAFLILPEDMLLKTAPVKEFLQGEYAGSILVAEGYATAASLHMATGKPVAVAFNAHNLVAVAEQLRARHPQAEITICADDDHHLSNNVGLEKAREAAQAVGGKLTMPNFSREERANKLTDFNDLHKSRGIDAVEKQVVWPLRVQGSHNQGAER
ncbi:zincin-like metallopeptidase domain-containing protein [Desulfobulbus elongatus]|uniref:zincin-like metallopeptidase domain-containing protein n=1 Tax=Desulfobulbus elongatus TaxID=53332 RepID=UPI0006886DA6|nr:zincin-like metallopeptidase domain-containing protein [Desulfobulbus elongatus]